MNQLDEASHADKAKKAREAQKTLPARNKAKPPEKAQAGNLEKPYSDWRL
jgi:hypothetical protein